MLGKYCAEQIWIFFFNCRVSQSSKCSCTWEISNRRRPAQCFLGRCRHGTHFSHTSQDGCSTAVPLWETHGILGHISSSRMQMMTNVGALGVRTDYIIPGSLYSVLGSELQESNQNEDN